MRERGMEERRGEKRKGKKEGRRGRGGEREEARKEETTCMDASHSCVVSNKLSVSDDWDTEGSRGGCVQGAHKATKLDLRFTMSHSCPQSTTV